MRKCLLVLLMWLTLLPVPSAWAQTPDNGLTTIPNWLWVKPGTTDRNKYAFCVWGGLSLSIAATCDTEIISVDATVRPLVLEMVNGIYISGNNIQPYGAGPINFLSSIYTSGSLAAEFNIDVDGYIYNNGAGALALNDDVAITGTLSDSNSNLIVNDNLDITGDLSVTPAGTLGSIYARANSGKLNLDINAASGKDGCLSFSEVSVASRWAWLSANGSALMQLKQGTCTGTTVWEWDSAGNITTDQTTGTITFGDSTNKFETMFLSLDGISSGILNVVTNSTGELFYDSSTRRIKKNIVDAPTPLKADVLALRPRRYNDIRESDVSPKALGLIAEEIPASLQADLVVQWSETRFDDQGLPYPFEVVSVKYDKVALLLLDIIKNLEARIAALEKKP